MTSILEKLFSSSFEIKITDETDLNLESKVTPLLEELITESIRKKLKTKKVEIIIPEDFGLTVYKYSSVEGKEHYDKFGYSNSQGHFSAPFDKKATDFKVIINKSTFEEVQYFSTLFHEFTHVIDCLLYTSPSPRDRTRSRMPSSA